MILKQDNLDSNSVNNKESSYSKKQFEAVLYYIQRMDSQMLDLIMDESQQYNEYDKKTFIHKLSNVFDEYRENGNTFLHAFEGKCNSKICDNTNCTGYSFVGNKTNQYMDLIIEVGTDNVLDILECNTFINHQEGIIKTGKISIDSQQIPF